MKKLLVVLLSILMVVTMFGCKNEPEQPAANKLEAIKKAGTLVIGTEGDWSPWTYHDETGKLVGFDVEVGTRIAELLGVEAKFEESGWDSLLAGVDAERFDIVCNGVGYTESRAEKYDFSDAYVYTRKVLIVSKDNTDINSFEDLKGKTTANTASSTYAAIAQEYGATVTPVDDFVQTIELVTQKRIDATINSEVSYLDYIAQHPESPVKVVANSAGEKVCYPVKKGETELLNAVNDALKTLRDNGELAALSVKYFGGDITNAD